MSWTKQFAAWLNLAAWLKPVRRPGRAAPAQAALLQQSTDSAMLQQSQTALGLFLGLSDSDALALACTVLAHRQTLSAARRQPAAPGAAAHTAGQRSADANTLSRALAQGSCLLALPCNVAALQWLGTLASSAAAPMVLVHSTALQPLLAGLGWPAKLPAGRLQCCSATEVIQHVKARRSGAAPATLYVSFPELHAAGADTSAQVRFLGQTVRWSLLEPLLCLQGLKTLLTLAPADGLPSSPPADPAPALALRSRSTLAPGPHGPGDSPGAILAWLVGHLEAAARSQPGLALAWPQLYRASAPFQAITRSNRLKQVEAFFEAWQAAGGGLQQQTQAYLSTRLAALRSSG